MKIEIDFALNPFEPLAMSDIMGLILVYALIIAALLLSLVVEKKYPKIDSRKVVHIGVGNFVFVWWLFTQQWAMLVFFTIPFAIILFIAMFRGNAISESKLGDLSRKGHNSGLFLYAITITVLVWLFFDNWVAASVAIVAMTYGDGFGSVIGRRWGKHKIINGKSLEGSVAVFAATFIMSLVVFGMFNVLSGAGLGTVRVFDNVGYIPQVYAALIAGLLASFLEAICNGNYDNFVNPIIVAFVMVICGF